MVSNTGSDFSTNQHVGPKGPQRHPDLCFEDGNLAVLATPFYFLVHQGILTRRSSLLNATITEIASSSARLEGRPVFQIDGALPEHVYLFLYMLYDGISSVLSDSTGSRSLSRFDSIAAVLRLAAQFEDYRLRRDLLQELSVDWPEDLEDWDTREARATDINSVYRPRDIYPHPIAVMRLSYDVSAPQLLPSAFYDFSRSMPHAIIQDAMEEALPQDTLSNILRGREHASRFLSTFLVNHLEGRMPAHNCIYQTSIKSLKRSCQSSFEAIAFESLRDANGVVCQRNSDPLFAILDARMMQADRRNAACRPCESCRAEFSLVVTRARQEFWRRLPEWFGVNLATWA